MNLVNVLLYVSLAALAFGVVSLIVSAVAAARAGIIRTVFPLNKKQMLLNLIIAAFSASVVIGYANEAAKFDVQADEREAQGISAYAEYYGVELDSLTETAYENFGQWIEEDRLQARENRERARAYGALTAWGAISVMLNGAFVTSKGVREFGGFKNKTALIKAKDGELLLYEENRPDPILKLPENEANRERLKNFTIT